VSVVSIGAFAENLSGRSVRLSYLTVTMRPRRVATLRPCTYHAKVVRFGIPRLRTSMLSDAELFHE
jgi:hypothetical protein